MPFAVGTGRHGGCPSELRGRRALRSYVQEIRNMKRQALAAILFALVVPTASAQVSDDVVRIGVLTDMSSWGRDNAGPGSAEGARMAAEEVGGIVLGKKIAIVVAD